MLVWVSSGGEPPYSAYTMLETESRVSYLYGKLVIPEQTLRHVTVVDKFHQASIKLILFDTQNNFPWNKHGQKNVERKIKL